MRLRIYKGRYYTDLGRLYLALRDVENGTTRHMKDAAPGFYEDKGPWPPLNAAGPVITSPVEVVPTAPTESPQVTLVPATDLGKALAEITRLKELLNQKQELLASLTQQNIDLQKSLENALNKSIKKEQLKITDVKAQ